MQLIKHPNEWLEKQVKDFDFAKLNAEEISQKMINCMQKFGGIGLSANQVALNAQIFVMKPSLLETNEPFEVINPEILFVSNDITEGTEGCLSYPGLHLDVKRPATVLAEYFDKHNNQCKITLHNLDARCFLHEYDHLQGICFTERVSKLKLQRAIKKQRKKLKNGRSI